MSQDFEPTRRTSSARATSGRLTPVRNAYRGLALFCLFAVAFVTLLLAACTTQPPQLLSLFFEPSPPPVASVHKPRHPPYKPPNAPILIKVTKPPPRTDWVAMLELLPKDANGATDWVGALNGNLITPKPGLGPKDEEQPVMDMDVELVPKEGPEFKATYPHKLHTTLLACTNCHTGIFQMEKGADPITMDKIFAGEYCGRCHGKVAFDPITACPRCHLGLPK